MAKIDKLLKRAPRTKITAGDYISSGSTMLNMALTGSTDKGFLGGHYYRFVGDSSSGKTFLMLTAFAEANLKDTFKDYNFVFDCPEDGAGFDFEKFFGAAVKERVVPPRGTQNDPEYSGTVEDFYDSLDDWLKKGPCVYCLDSMDCLTTLASNKKYTKQKAKRDSRRRKPDVEQADEPGSMNMDKMRVNSLMLGKIMPLLRRTKSILIVISQTRDLIGGFSPNPGVQAKTTGGGHALKFYTRCELWTSVKRHIYSDTVRGKKWEQGIHAQVRIKKNRQTGKDWSVVVPIYHSVGIDDTGSCVDYLVDLNEWKQSGKEGPITASDFAVKKDREELVQFIEASPKRMKLLRAVVRRVWRDVEEKTSVERIRRYQ